MTATSTPATGVLDVPGARLHHTVQGAGPLLLLVPGGAADSGVFAGLAPLLAADRTVVTYDPRGLGASTVDDPAAAITVAGQADDARRLIAAHAGDGPVDVLASSGGALTGLELVARHPGLVRTLVAHEPPLTYLLPEEVADQDRADAAVMDVYRREGTAPAILAFLRRIGVLGDGPLPPVEAVAPMVPNFAVFFGRMWDAIGAYRVDVDAVRAGGARVVVAVGATSTGQLAARAATALAAVLGVPPTEVPGDHGGFMTEPAAFAGALRRILAAGELFDGPADPDWADDRARIDDELHDRWSPA